MGKGGAKTRLVNRIGASMPQPHRRFIPLPLNHVSFVFTTSSCSSLNYTGFQVTNSAINLFNFKQKRIRHDGNGKEEGIKHKCAFGNDDQCFGEVSQARARLPTFTYAIYFSEHFSDIKSMFSSFEKFVLEGSSHFIIEMTQWWST